MLQTKMSKSTRYLLTALSAFADKNGVIKYVGIKVVAREADISERHARRLLKRLDEYGLVKIVRAPGDCCEFRLPRLTSSAAAR
jgi:DNA-binding IscR family transcriptional regulator